MADDGKVKLFGNRFSPFVQRVQIALKEKKIPFELVEVDLGKKPQELLDANPIYKKVPAIIHNSKGVAESLVILEYLEDAFPEHSPLLPEDAFEKSKVRFWVDYIYKTHPSITASLTHQAGTPEQQAAYAVTLNFVKMLDAALTDYSADGPFFTGDTFGLVDVAMAPLSRHVGLFEALGGSALPGPDALPRFYRWIEAVSSHPSVTSTLLSPDEFLEFFRKRFQRLAQSGPAAAQ